MVNLLIFRVVNMALAYLLIIAASTLFGAGEYILFEKIMFFLMIGNIALSPIIIAMWHEKIVKNLIAEGLFALISLSLLAALLLFISTRGLFYMVAAGSVLYFFVYYLKTTLYTHLITLKKYYRAYSSNTLFYTIYILSIGFFASGYFFQSHLISFLIFPSLILIVVFLLQWRTLLGAEEIQAEKKKIRDIFSFSLLTHNLMTLLLLSGERFILEGYSSANEESLAAFLYLVTIISAFQSLGLSIGEWLRPQLFEKMRQGKSLFKLYQNAIIMLLFMFIAFLTAGWPVLQFISGDKMAFFSFFPYFSILTLSQLLFSLAFFIDIQIVFKKRYLLLLLASSTAVAGKTLGYYLWNGLDDLQGVVYANLLGAGVFFVSVVFFVYISKKQVTDAT